MKFKKFNLAKMVVAADDSSTADMIASLRNQLAGGNETLVNQDGTVFNPADPTSASSLASGDGFKPVDKAVVAADDSSTADMIASLRNQLAGGNETLVNQDGTVFNPADPTSASSLASGDGFKPVDKAVVAADDSSTADMIASLRNQLAGGNETLVNQDGTVFNPADPTSASSLASGDGFKPVDKAVVAADVETDADQPEAESEPVAEPEAPTEESAPVENETSAEIAALRRQLADGGEITLDDEVAPTNTTSSVEGGGGFKPVGKAIVAADDSSTADMIASLRNQLAGGNETLVNQDGTVFNPADPTSASSLASGDGFKPVDKAVVAAEWYRTNPELQRLEIKAMADIHPDAKMGYLPNGKMYWQLRLRPVVCGSRKDWTLLAVYDSDHPQQRWGGSVKFYPVKPNYNEMMQMVNRSSVSPKTIPHMLRDSDNQLYFCTQDRNLIHDGTDNSGKITTAAACLRFAMRWITVFELGLIDPETWRKFHRHGEI